jgi:hypothetical protein
MMTNTHIEARVTEHAKLLSYNGRQVLAFLAVDEQGQMTIVLQVWIARFDQQLRASVVFNSDTHDAVYGLFESLNEQTVGDLVKSVGLAQAIEVAEG